MSNTERSDTKYGDRLEDHEWSEPEPETEAPERTMVKDHEVDVIYVVDPDEDMGYGREKYTATIRYDDETGDPYVLYVVEHRWKGNYWRDTTDWEFQDIPEPVRQQVAAVLPVDRPTDLDTETRVIDEGGESRWKKHHKPRMEAYNDGGDIWAESSLKEAANQLDGAAENVSDEETEQRIDDLISEVQAITGEICAPPQEGVSE